MQHVNVIVVSEFGRRVLENADSGTDHGYGNVMLALGGVGQRRHGVRQLPRASTARASIRAPTST